MTLLSLGYDIRDNLTMMYIFQSLFQYLIFTILINSKHSLWLIMQETQPINNDQWLNNTLSFLLIIYNKQHGEYVNNKVCLLESILNSSLYCFYYICLFKINLIRVTLKILVLFMHLKEINIYANKAIGKCNHHSIFESYVFEMFVDTHVRFT